MNETQPLSGASAMQLKEAILASDRAKGWLTPGEQTLLYERALQVPAGGTIVELGSWNGRSTIMLAAGSGAGPKGTVYAVDLFANIGETSSAYSPHLEGENPEYFPLFERNIREAGVDSLVRPIRGETVESGRLWSHGPIDLLFIDADHSYEGVRSDFLEWSRHCRPGAWCLFHDYFNIIPNGVRRLVDPLIESGILADIDFADSIAYGRLLVTDRAEIERRLGRKPAWNPLRHLKQGNARDPKFNFSIYHGWNSWSKGDRSTAIRDGLSAIGLKPWHSDGWKLLTFSIIKAKKDAL